VTKDRRLTLDAGMLAQRLDDRRADYLRDLAELVALDSPTGDKQAVDRVGRLLRERLSALGCAVEMSPSATYGDTLMGTLHGDGKARVLLIGHLDTVYPLGTAAVRPFTLRDGCAYGPGTADMKGGLLLGLYAMEVLAGLARRPFACLSFVLNSDEEVGSPSSADFIAAQAAQADAVLVLEAARPNGALVSARKGIGTYLLSVRGRAAHAGTNPENGRNAIVELCHKLLAATALNGRWPGVTVTAGVVRGGTVSNVVPDAAEAEIDVRVPDEESARALDAALRALVADPVVDGTQSTLSGGLKHPPMPRRAGTVALLTLARRAASELGFEVGDVASGGASDANRPSAFGVPTLDGLGPVGAGAHSPDEHIRVASIVPRAALLARLIALCDEVLPLPAESVQPAGGSALPLDDA
jgi:glutamate carboxypeptidase